MGHVIETITGTGKDKQEALDDAIYLITHSEGLGFQSYKVLESEFIEYIPPTKRKEVFNSSTMRTEVTHLPNKSASLDKCFQRWQFEVDFHC